MAATADTTGMVGMAATADIMADTADTVTAVIMVVTGMEATGTRVMDMADTDTIIGLTTVGITAEVILIIPIGQATMETTGITTLTVDDRQDATSTTATIIIPDLITDPVHHFI